MYIHTDDHGLLLELVDGDGLQALEHAVVKILQEKKGQKDAGRAAIVRDGVRSRDERGQNSY